jgi:hypothetical protein
MNNPRPVPAQPQKKNREWIGAVLLLALIIGGVLAWRWLGGGTHGEDCTNQGTCGFGHLCIENPMGFGKVCAATCDDDADCDVGQCVPVQGRNSITGTATTTVIGADHVCTLN